MMMMIDLVGMCSAKEPGGVAGSTQSNFVRVTSDGSCSWWPRFEMSASHCPMNIAWFPFDEQRCELVYESWRYPSTELNISVPQEPVTLAHYKTSGEWNLVGTLHAERRHQSRLVSK